MVRTDALPKNLFLDAFCHSSVGMALVDLNGTWLAVNHEFCRITGYSRQALLHSRFQSITHPDDLCIKLELIKKLISDDIKSYNLEKRCIRQDGTIAFVWVTASLVRNENGAPQYFIWQMVDLTEQRSTELDREAFFTFSPDLLAISDNSGRLKDVSPAWTELLGWSKEELCSRPFIEFVHPDDRERTAQEAACLYAGRPTRGFRNRYRHVDGTYHWLEWNTRIVSGELYYNAVRDVTRQKETEDRQRVERDALKAASNGILITDATRPGNPVVHCNPAFERISGYSCEELMGKSCRILLASDTQQPGLLELQRAMHEGRPCKAVLRNYRKSGELYYNSLMLSPVKDESGTTHHFIGISEDITHQLRSEEELKNSELHLQQITANVPATIFQWYARSNGEMGFYYISDKCEELYGIKAETLMEDWTRIQVHPECRPALMESVQKAVREKSDWDFECRLLLEDGSIRWTRSRSTPTSITDDEIVFTGVILDVTKEHEAKEEQQNQEEKIRLLIENAHDAFVGINQNGVITEWNRKAQTLFGWTAQEAMEKPMVDLIIPEQAKSNYYSLMEYFNKKGKLNITNKIIELPARHKNGEEILLEMSASVIAHEGKNHFYAFLRDVSKRKEMERKLHHQATHDFLTDLPNRFEFISRLEYAIQRQTRLKNKEAIALLFIDLDGFKEVNDSLSHGAGDLVLKEFARRMKVVIRGSDTAARLGGDEFAILLQHLEDGLEGAKLVARKVIHAGTRDYEAGGLSCRVGVSIGITLHDGKETADTFLARADAAMYRAKQTGKNRMALQNDDQWIVLSS